VSKGTGVGAATQRTATMLATRGRRSMVKGPVANRLVEQNPEGLNRTQPNSLQPRLSLHVLRTLSTGNEIGESQNSSAQLLRVELP
jgi:hypothetical protein